MIEKTDNMPTQNTQQTPVSARPNESGRIMVDGFVRIFDPHTKETIVEVRE